MSMGVGPVAALGIFDGVHLGHQKILEQTVLRARQLKTEALVLTFHPHPQVVLGGEGPKLITTLEDRQALIRGCGIHRVLVESFTPSFAQLTPEEFFTEVIVGKLQVREIVVGYDYTFGQGGAGNVETLRTLGQAQGIQVHRVSPVEIAGRKVSSTLIRELVTQGQVEKARILLGRPFFLRGKVIHGEGLARQWRVPTANLAVSEEILWPMDGVYLATAEMSAEGELPAIVSIGTKPTFDGRERVIEVHILDRQWDLYDNQLTVFFHRFVRPQRRFGSEAELFAQVHRDIAEARIFFATPSKVECTGE